MTLSADGKTFFNATSTLFRKVSPEYPPKLIDTMLTSMGFESSSYSERCIADIGSGAGHSARPLLERGFKVHCVDPSEKMNEELREVLVNLSAKNCYVKVGTSANTTLDEGSVDGIVLGNALHWLINASGKIDDDTLNEFRRILKQEGKIGVLFCMQKPGAPIYNIVNDVCTEVLGEKYNMHRHNLTEVLRHTVYVKQLIQPDMMVEHIDTYRRVAESDEAFKEWLSSYTFVADAEPHEKKLISQRAVEELNRKKLIATDGSIAMEWHVQAYTGPIINSERVATPQSTNKIEAEEQQLKLMDLKSERKSERN